MEGLEGSGGAKALRGAEGKSEVSDVSSHGRLRFACLSLDLSGISREDIGQGKPSFIVMKITNERKLILEGPIFHFHDCGRNGMLQLQKKSVLPKKGRKTSMFPSFQMEADDDCFEQKSSGIFLFSNILKAPFRHFPGSTANCVFLYFRMISWESKGPTPPMPSPFQEIRPKLKDY